MRGRVLAAVLLIILGGLLLLNNFGLLNVAVGDVIWPAVLIALGLWFLLGATLGGRSLETERVEIPLNGARSAQVKLRYGAGKLTVTDANAPDVLLSGEFTGGLDYRSSVQSERMMVELGIPENRWWNFLSPWDWHRGFDWSIEVNDALPIDLSLETGATDTQLNLERLQVRRLELKTGASSTLVNLPANAGEVKVTVEAGAASVTLHVPDGVAGRVRARAGLSEIKVDPARFVQSGDMYQTADFDTADNKADIDIQAGVGAVRVT